MEHVNKIIGVTLLIVLILSLVSYILINNSQVKEDKVRIVFAKFSDGTKSCVETTYNQKDFNAKQDLFRKMDLPVYEVCN